MDTEIDQLLALSSKRASLGVELELAKARFAEMTRHSQYGGTFQITPILIQEVAALAQDHTPRILIDAYGWPVEIVDCQVFLDRIKSKYTSAKQRFHLDVVKARSDYQSDLFE